MASLTPGSLAKLLSGSDSAGKHRSTLLQVIEIVPSISASDSAASSWLSPAGGFFLKLSDSANSAFVSVSDHADAELVRSDAVRLGQFVHVARLDSAAAAPVPAVRGLRPVPRRLRKAWPCIGNPVELVSSEALFQKRRLSLDSRRRSWQINSNDNHNLVVSPLEASPRKVSSSKHANLIISPLKSKNGTASPLPAKKPPRKESKNSSSEATLPTELTKLVPIDVKPGSGQKISWDTLPPTIAELGKQTAHHRRIALSAAVLSLEEASAADEVIRCMCVFAELCKSLQNTCAVSVVQKYMDLIPTMLSAAKVVDSLMNSRLSNADSTSHLSQQPWSSDSHKVSPSKNGSLWIKAALRTDLATFNLFKKQDKDEVQSDEKHHYVVIESPRNADSKNYSPTAVQNKKNQRALFSGSAAKRPPPTPARLSSASLLSDSSRLSSAARKSSAEKEDFPKQSRLNDAATLSQKLLSASRGWFFNYLEDSLDKGFGMKRGEEKSLEFASLLGQLKRVDRWLDDLATSGSRKDKKIDGLRKKLHGFLSENCVCYGK